jgi:aminotransferase in exopolysaccharide biosynthesis
VERDDLVITQPMTFVATCNAITYCGAEPVFIDVDRHTMGLSATAVDSWLDENALVGDDQLCRTRADLKIIRACVPMHTFGHPVDLDRLLEVCSRWNIAVVEDAAESLGSLYKGRHTGTFGQLGVLSFNGNKVITTGGGGMILADEALAQQARHLTTTAKEPHDYEYIHNEVGYNYRLPNLNAALGCAQLEQLESFVAAKRGLARRYADFLDGSELTFFSEPVGCRSNYWLNAVICDTRQQRNEIIESTNEKGVMTRPVWALMNQLKMYSHCRKGELTNAQRLGERVVNVPSSVVGGFAE